MLAPDLRMAGLEFFHMMRMGLLGKPGSVVYARAFSAALAAGGAKAVRADEGS